MNRPYIFCHMMTSLDGKIMGNYMDTPEGAAAGDVFYNISFGKDPYYKHQGWLSGRVTTDDNFTFYEKPELDEHTPAVPAGDFVAEKTGMYYVPPCHSSAGSRREPPAASPSLPPYRPSENPSELFQNPLDLKLTSSSRMHMKFKGSMLPNRMFVNHKEGNRT